MTDLENIEKGIHFNRNYSKTGFTKKTVSKGTISLFTTLTVW